MCRDKEDWRNFKILCLTVSNDFEGDVRDEAAVLDWVLVQAGMKAAGDDEEDGGIVEEVMEEIDEILTFPGASAETQPPPPQSQPKLTPPETKKQNKSQNFDPSEEATPEPLSEIVDIIKNDNNVVVFFCKYFTNKSMHSNAQLVSFYLK